MMTHRLTVWVCLLALGLAAGCSPYINIPAQAGDIAGHDANGDTVIEVEAAALKAVAEDGGFSTYQIKLVPDSWPQTHDKAVALIGEGAQWATNPDPTVALLEARQVRIRGWFAEVDVVRPADPSNPQSGKVLATADLKHDMFAGWHPQRVRVWRINVDKALEQSRIESEHGMGQE